MLPKSCRHDKKDIVLYYYGELDAVETADIDVRLSVCSSCREYLSELAAMESVLPRSPSVEPSETVMEAIRAATSKRLKEREGARNRREGARNRREGAHNRRAVNRSRSVEPGRSSVFIPGWARMATALSAAVLVFLGGRLSMNLVQPAAIEGNRDAVMAEGNRDAVMDVSDLVYDDETGTLSVQFSTAGESEVTGTLNDQKVRSLVTYALMNSHSPATRFQAAKLLAEVEFGLAKPDPDLVSALASILSDDANEGMQLQAIAALRRIYDGLPLDSTLTELLIDLLGSSSNSALRIQSLEILTESELARQDLNRVLARASQDPNSFVRLKAQSTLDNLESSIPLDKIN